MASIDSYDTIFEGYNKIAEKIDLLQGELYDNIELGEFKNYILNEMTKLKLQVLDYQQVFTEEYGKELDSKKDGLSL